MLSVWLRSASLEAALRVSSLQTLRLEAWQTMSCFGPPEQLLESKYYENKAMLCRIRADCQERT